MAVTVHRDAMVGIALLGAAFAAGMYCGKKYFPFRNRRSQKMFEGQDDPRRAYLLHYSIREHPTAKKLRLQLSANVIEDVAQLLGNLAKVIKSKKVLDLGWSSGYNTLILALAISKEGKVTVNVSDAEGLSLAKKSWKEAGVDHKIDIQLKPSEQTLDDLLSSGASGTFDLISINMADGQNCKKIFEKSLRLLRSGGILAVDGVLCKGAVLKMHSPGGDHEMHQLNKAVLRDARVSLNILPLGDGLMLCFKL